MEEKKERCNLWYAKKAFNNILEEVLNHSKEGTIETEKGGKAAYELMVVCYGFIKDFDTDCGCKACFDHAIFLLKMIQQSAVKFEFLIGKERVQFVDQSKNCKGE